MTERTVTGESYCGQPLGGDYWLGIVVCILPDGHNHPHPTAQ